MQSKTNLNTNLIKLIEKYFLVINQALSNRNLFKLDFPGAQTLFEISNIALSQILYNPINFIQYTIEYQLNLTQKILENTNTLEIINQVHLQLHLFYQKLVNNLNLNAQDKQYLLFFIKQLFNAIAPDNFLFFNEKAFNLSLESNFENLLQGLNKLQEDLKNQKEFFNITNTNKSAFKIGANIAITPGRIIYKNQLIELIHYTPKNESFAIPILIVPPCINKYYILDLSPENSFVKWLVENNFQVFLISWVNPTSQAQNFEFQDYITQGILKSSNFINQHFGYDKINTIGYCIGGTMLAVALSVAKETGNKIFGCATFLNTMLDFSNPGEISIFMRDEIIKHLQSIANQYGYLDGIYLYTIFNILKSNDLIWSAYINNYLKGNEAKSSDILHWNCDYVNLPAKMFEFYIHNMYINNFLIQPYKIKIDDIPINLQNIDVETFFLAAQSDHIVPWQTNYNGTHYLGGNKTFCLSGSGHVMGVINPPNTQKYAYWTHKICKNADNWFTQAQKTSGSWWQYHLSWLKNHSGQLTKSINFTDQH